MQAKSNMFDMYSRMQLALSIKVKSKEIGHKIQTTVYQ